MKKTSAIRPAVWAIFAVMCLHNLGQNAFGYLSEQEAQEAYDRLKALEKVFPWPTNTATVAMGTFYPNKPAAANFVGVHTTNSSTPVIVNTEGLYVKLSFRVQPPDFGPHEARLGECTIKGSHYQPPQYVSIPGDNNTVVVDVGLADKVHWGITAYNSNGVQVSHSDVVIIKRTKPYYACGAFLVPALPVALIYAPPQTSSNGNMVTYTISQSVGTTLDMSVSRENSTSSPTETGFGDLSKLKSGVGALAGAVKSIPVVSTIVQGFNSFLNGLGNETASATSGKIEVTGNSLSIIDTFTDATSPLPGQGPGHGDLIVFKKNALFAWTLNGDTYSQTLLNDRPNYSTFSMDDLASDYASMIPGGTLAEWTVPVLDTNHPAPGDPEFPPPAKANTAGPLTIHRPSSNMLAGLKKPRPGLLLDSNQISNLRGPITGLDPATILSLARLDPFTSASNYTPLLQYPGIRYVEADESPFEFSSSIKQMTFSHTTTTADYGSGTDYHSETHNYSKGWLSFLGIGETENKTVVSTMKCTGQWRDSQMQTCETKVSFNAALREPHTIRCFFDRAFGTFAFEEGPSTPVAAFEDTARDANGNPMPNQLVSLSAGGKRFWTKTDARGRFSFHSAEIPRGPAKIQIGTGHTSTIEITRLPPPVKPPAFRTK